MDASVRNGIVRDLDNDEYHSGPEVSNTGLGNFEISPYHYWAHHINPDKPPSEEKAGQATGILAHCAVLEPDALSDRYIVGPDVHKSTKVWKSFVTDHPRQICIKQKEWDAALAMRDNVWMNAETAKILSKGSPEVSVFFDDPETGVRCRTRPDWVHDTGNGIIMLDVKTYSDASPAEFARQVARKNYFRQNALYADSWTVATGEPVLGFVFLAIETTYPYASNVCMLDDEAIEAGRRRYQSSLRGIAECLRKNEWPSYDQSIDLISIPPWKLEEY